MVTVNSASVTGSNTDTLHTFLSESLQGEERTFRTVFFLLSTLIIRDTKYFTTIHPIMTTKMTLRFAFFRLVVMYNLPVMLDYDVFYNQGVTIEGKTTSPSPQLAGFLKQGLLYFRRTVRLVLSVVLGEAGVTSWESEKRRSRREGGVSMREGGRRRRSPRRVE